MAEAIETCKIRKHVNYCLKGSDGILNTKLDLCQYAIEDRQWKSAKRIAKKTIEELKARKLGLHAKAI